jgi:hypothetical protein
MDEVIYTTHELMPHLIAFTETWLTPEITDGEVQIPGYECLRSDRSQCRGGGGVILYYQQGMNVQLLDTFASHEGDEEYLCCRVRSGPKFVTIVVIYRSPGAIGSHTLEQIEHWRRKNDCLITGDFNAPGVDWTTLTCSNSPCSFDATLLNGRWMQTLYNMFMSQLGGFLVKLKTH